LIVALVHKAARKDREKRMSEKEELRIGVYVCHCGSNIGGVIDVKDVVDYAATLPGVVISKDNKYMCADPGQALIREDIKKHHLNRVVVAACSVRLHL
jgi:heterodisulfide reductase subunit A2